MRRHILSLLLLPLLLAGCSHSTNTEGSRPQAWLQPGTKVTVNPFRLSWPVSTTVPLVMLMPET